MGMLSFSASEKRYSASFSSVSQEGRPSDLRIVNILLLRSIVSLIDTEILNIKLKAWFVSQKVGKI